MTDVRTSDKTSRHAGTLAYKAGVRDERQRNMLHLEGQLQILIASGELTGQLAYEIFTGAFNEMEAGLRFPEPTGQFDASQIDQYREDGL